MPDKLKLVGLILGLLVSLLLISKYSQIVPNVYAAFLQVKGTPLRWFPQDIPVKFYMHDVPNTFAGTSTYDEVHTAMFWWNSAGADVQIEDAGFYSTCAGCPDYANNNKNELVFRLPDNLDLSGGEDTPYTVFQKYDCNQTMTVSGQTFCRIIEVDITFEAISADLAAYALGRALGLGVSGVSGSVMNIASLNYPGVSGLSQDDTDSLRAIYSTSASSLSLLADQLFPSLGSQVKFRGTATNISGAPLTGTPIKLINSSDGSVLGNISTDASGNYTFNYTVSSLNRLAIYAKFDGDASNPASLSQILTIIPTIASNINIDVNSLTPAINTTITFSGQLEDLAGRPISGKVIKLICLQGTACGTASATTDANGNYAIPLTITPAILTESNQFTAHAKFEGDTSFTASQSESVTISPKQ